MSGAIFETKSTEVLKNALSVTWHPKLVELYLWELIRYGSERLMVTCSYEPRTYNSVHSVIPLRGYDLRERLFKRPEEIANDIQKHWIYDPERPDFKVVRLHARCPKCGFDHEPPIRELCDKCEVNIRGHWHFHNQVHDNTVMIKQATKEENS